MEEKNDTYTYSYYWNEETKLLTVYEDNGVLSTVQGVQTKEQAEELFKEDVFNIAGVEL